MKSSNSLPILLFVVIFGCGIAISYFLFFKTAQNVGILMTVCSFLVALFFSSSVKVANQWERVIMLRLGKFQGLRGPGLFLIIPIIDTLPYWIDLRVITTSFKAEKTLTKDTVPVDVDAVLFWQVIDPTKTALEVEDYKNAISWASQTALRDVIGKTLLSQMLEGREHLDDELQKIIGNRIASWGIRVLSVEIRDVIIPQGLHVAMSMQAQAERERQARVILADSERQIAQKFEEASHVYQDNPTALHLRAMNMLYEGLKENATLVIVPSTAVESMQLGTITGLTALQKAFEQERERSKKEDQAMDKNTLSGGEK